MVIHVMRDGSQVKDITGHVVKMQDAKMIYTLISKINERRKENEN